MQYKKFLLLINIFVLTPVHASDWPMFTAPDLGYLLSHQIIQAQHCPTGQGKIATQVAIPVNSFCKKKWCPSGWMWQSVSDQACHDLNSGFTTPRYEITRHRGQDGMTEYSTVHAYYANAEFIFITPKEHWECYEFVQSQDHYVSCANDI